MQNYFLDGSSLFSRTSQLYNFLFVEVHFLQCHWQNVFGSLQPLIEVTD